MLQRQVPGYIDGDVNLTETTDRRWVGRSVECINLLDSDDDSCLIVEDDTGLHVSLFLVSAQHQFVSRDLAGETIHTLSDPTGDIVVVFWE